MSRRRPRQLALPHAVVEQFPPLPIDTAFLENLAVAHALSSDAVAAFFFLVCWTWRYGPLPRLQAGRQTIARQLPRVFRSAWRELAPLFSRRRDGYVLRWLEHARDQVMTERATASLRASKAGKVSASHRAASARQVPASPGARVIRPDRFSRPPVTLKTLVKFCDDEVFKPFYDAGREEPPSVELLKTLARKFFSWDEDPDMPGKAFAVVENRYERTATAWRSNDRRHGPHARRERRQLQRWGR